MSNEEKIIKMFGKNHTKPAVYSKGSALWGIYTYKGQACFLEGGMDTDFCILDEKRQSEIVAALETGKYKFDDSFQG